MTDFTEQQREAASIRADMQRVYKIMNDAKARYIKEKLKVKSKKQAKDAERLFAEIAPYGSKDEIHNHYGWEGISFSEYERLTHLWDMREQYNKDGKTYSDRVTDMLAKAMSHIGDDYQDFLEEADSEARKNKRNQQSRF